MEYFSHGENLQGVHVDVILEKDNENYPKYVREATEEEKKEFCK